METLDMKITPDILLAKKEEAPVLFTIFENKVAKYGEKRLYCFVENYDMPYYSSPILNNGNKDWTSIRCNGKRKVLEIYEYIKDISEYKKYTKRFFVDADFDNNSNISNDVYVTPGYSVENFYIHEECMRKILETEYEIDPVGDKELFDKTMSLYKLRLDQFHQAVVKLNAWYACLVSDKGLSRDGVNLGKKFPTDLLKYSIDKDITATYTLQDIEKKFPKASKLDCSLIASKEKELIGKPYLLRGKYEIEFLIKFIKFLNKDAGTVGRQFTKKSKNFSFNDDGVLTSLAPYSYVPNSLKLYIRNGKRLAG